MDSGGMHESQVQNEIPSDEFVLHPRLPSLQEMAYNQIAIAVWYRYSLTPSQRQRYEGFHHDDWATMKLELMDCDKLIKTLAIPRLTKENLKKYVKRVREQTISCTVYFRYKLLSGNLEEYRIPQVDWEYFVWRPDGKINFKSTAIKMLHSGVLTEVQKFAIMCNFCLENEIKIFDLKRLPMETFISKVIRDRDPLFLHWFCYLENESYRITPHPSFRSYGNHFFWNSLSAEDQVPFMSDRLRTFERSYWHDSWFYNMSHDELTNLLFHQPVPVILVFIKKIEMLEWAIMAWKRCKHRISNEQFVELLHSLLDRSYLFRIHKQEHKMSVLLEIWNTANDHHKNYAARQARLGEAVLNLLAADPDTRVWKKLAPSCFKFLLKFLSLTSADFRKNLIPRGDLSFIFYFDFHVVHEIFELCLPNSQGKTELKINDPSNYRIRPYFCKILYTVEDRDELNRRLLRSVQNLNIPSKDILQKFIESLIVANKREYKTHYPYNSNDESDFLGLSKFINKILQENVSTVLKMKESYFASLISATSDPYERYCSLNELSILIEQEFVHEHQQVLKHRLVKILQKTSVERWVWIMQYYGIYKRVFSWCFENDEKMFLQVKRCIPIKHIIRDVSNRTARGFASFIILKRFLLWYFSDMEEEFISFKLGMRNDYLERFLEWYFVGVQKEMLSFKPRILMNRSDQVLELVQELDKQLPRKFLQWMGHPVDLRFKISTYDIVSFLFFICFAIFAVVYVHP
ncbi:uncharacterized protein LOC135844730 [Planococcus citri]|uniref:uncharacterized protein LOC135844730 n=1 Tax=Planococcus citri TaxID=170843 RepID=UPI0031F9933D